MKKKKGGLEGKVKKKVDGMTQELRRRAKEEKKTSKGADRCEEFVTSVDPKKKENGTQFTSGQEELSFLSVSYL